MNENTKTLIFVAIMCVVVAALLAGLRGVTYETAIENEKIFNQRAILLALGDNLPTPVDALSDEEVQNIFQEQMKSSVAVDVEGEVIGDINPLEIRLDEERKKDLSERKFPLFVYENSGKKFYIISMRGNGLWDEIWGNMALESDVATVAGVSFDHAGETPGLGAEIKDNKNWVNQFSGRSVLSDYNGKYTGVIVRKGGAKDKKYEVDGLSGATVTADGVTDMIQQYMSYYEPTLQKLKADGKLGMK